MSAAEGRLKAMGLRRTTGETSGHRVSARVRSVLSDSLPGLRLLRQYQLGWLRGDVIAGVVLAAYLIPAGIGDASLAGLPPEAGLYSCLFAGLVFWLFCSSRHTAVTVTSAISLVVGTSLGDLAGGDATRFAALASATALIVAVLAFAAWAFGAGSLVSFISETVMTGFKTGVALHLASTQLPKLFGFKGAHGDFWERMGHFFSHLSETNPASLALGAAALGVLFLGQEAAPEPSGGAPGGGGRHRRGRDARTGRARRGPPGRRPPGPARARPAARSSLRPEPAPAPGHGVLPAGGGGDGGHRTDVRPQARLPARQQPGAPRPGREQSRLRAGARVSR